MLVQDFLHLSAERSPDKVALVCDSQRLTYAEIEAMATKRQCTRERAWGRATA